MFSRKSLFVALTVVMMLAMLVPVSFAAPEWTHGISIVSPTTAAPKWVKYDGAGTTFDIKYNIASTGASVADVKVTAYLLNANGAEMDKNVVTLQAPVAADQTLKFSLKGMIPDGWYGLKLCAIDLQEPAGDPAPELFCTAVAANAVVLDSKKPFNVAIIEPVNSEKVTAEHEIIATAEDAFPGHVAKVEFFYQLDSNDDNWIKLGEKTETNGVENHYAFLWDTTTVPDGWYNLKVRATDEVGWWTDSKTISVMVDNGYTIDLVPGWNLISTPIMLYDPSIASVLGHLKDAAGNPTWAAIHTMSNDGGDYEWMSADSASGQGDLDEMVDGKGYWLYMKADQDLWLRGTWAQVGPFAPPQYMVSKGWNLIGFTNWGKPPAFPMTRKAYLGDAVNAVVQVMYKYNPNTGLFSAVAAGDDLKAGNGYWLALSDDGTVYP